MFTFVHASSSSLAASYHFKDTSYSRSWVRAGWLTSDLISSQLCSFGPTLLSTWLLSQSMSSQSGRFQLFLFNFGLTFTLALLIGWYKHSWWPWEVCMNKPGRVFKKGVAGAPGGGLWLTEAPRAGTGSHRPILPLVHTRIFIFLFSSTNNLVCFTLRRVIQPLKSRWGKLVNRKK